MARDRVWSTRTCISNCLLRTSKIVASNHFLAIIWRLKLYFFMAIGPNMVSRIHTNQGPRWWCQWAVFSGYWANELVAGVILDGKKQNLSWQGSHHFLTGANHYSNWMESGTSHWLLLAVGNIIKAPMSVVLSQCCFSWTLFTSASKQASQPETKCLY